MTLDPTSKVPDVWRQFKPAAEHEVTCFLGGCGSEDERGSCKSSLSFMLRPVSEKSDAVSDSVISRMLLPADTQTHGMATGRDASSRDGGARPGEGQDNVIAADGIKVRGGSFGEGLSNSNAQGYDGILLYTDQAGVKASGQAASCVVPLPSQGRDSGLERADSALESSGKGLFGRRGVRDGCVIRGSGGSSTSKRVIPDAADSDVSYMLRPVECDSQAVQLEAAKTSGGLGPFLEFCQVEGSVRGLGTSTESQQDACQDFPKALPSFRRASSGDIEEHGLSQFREGCFTRGIPRDENTSRAGMGQKRARIRLCGKQTIDEARNGEGIHRPAPDACSSEPVRPASLLQETVSAKVRKALKKLGPQTRDESAEGKWQCPECHVLVPTGSKFHHFRTRHPQCDIERIKIARPSVVAATKDLPQEQTGWTCPILGCGHKLPVLGSQDHKRAVREHCRKCHPKETPRTLAFKSLKGKPKRTKGVSRQQLANHEKYRFERFPTHEIVRVVPPERLASGFRGALYYCKVCLSPLHKSSPQGLQTCQERRARIDTSHHVRRMRRTWWVRLKNSEPGHAKALAVAVGRSMTQMDEDCFVNIPHTARSLELARAKALREAVRPLRRKLGKQPLTREEATKRGKRQHTTAFLNKAKKLHKCSTRGRLNPEALALRKQQAGQNSTKATKD